MIVWICLIAYLSAQSHTSEGQTHFLPGCFEPELKLEIVVASYLECQTMVTDLYRGCFDDLLHIGGPESILIVNPDS